jgi:hypothetical protein
MATFELPPLPGSTHKTEGLNKTELRFLLTDIEQTRTDKAMAKIEGDLSWLPKNANLIDLDAAVIGKPGSTCRDVLRSAFARYQDASSYSTSNPDFIKGLQLNAFFGLLESDARVTEILKGLPL